MEKWIEIFYKYYFENKSFSNSELFDLLDEKYLSDFATFKITKCSNIDIIDISFLMDIIRENFSVDNTDISFKFTVLLGSTIEDFIYKKYKFNILKRKRLKNDICNKINDIIKLTSKFELLELYVDEYNRSSKKLIKKLNDIKEKIKKEEKEDAKK